MGRRPRLRDYFAGHEEASNTPPYEVQGLIDMTLEGEDEIDHVEKTIKELHKFHQKLKDEAEDSV